MMESQVRAARGQAPGAHAPPGGPRRHRGRLEASSLSPARPRQPRPSPGCSTSEAADGAEALPPSLSRVVLSAQEDMRRDIARAMHDGPAQSLTNIVLQAQIVDRLTERDPVRARAEVRLLVSMVQQTLDATKNFIFDVRPMVLDDLGLVPDAPPLDPGTRPAGARPRRVRVAGPGPSAADGCRERHLPDPGRGARRVTSRWRRTASRCGSTGPTSSRHGSRRPGCRCSRRASRCPRCPPTTCRTPSGG